MAVMRIPFCLMVVFSSAISASAGLVSGTRCEIAAPPFAPLVQTDPDLCLVEMTLAELEDPEFTNGHRAGAFIRHNVDYADDGTASVRFQTRNLVEAFNTEPFGKSAQSTTEFDWTFWLTTPGPVRPGRLWVVGNDIISDSTIRLDGEFNLSELSIAGQSYGGFGLSADIVLGQPFQVRMQGSTRLDASPSTAFRFGDVLIEFWSQAQELDGTPVALEPIPEPATVSLFAAGLAVLWSRRRRA